jgi:hypothetical protein
LDAFIYRESFGPAPVTIDIEVYEMDGATEVIFHNYLVKKEGPHNTLLRFPKQYILDDEHYIFTCKELTDWAGKGTKIQEHGQCMSDIIAVDCKKENTSSEHPPSPKGDDNIFRDKES